MDKEIIKILKELKTDFNFTDVDIAFKMKVSYSTVRSWQTGIRNPNQFAKEKLIQILRANQRVGIKTK